MTSDETTKDAPAQGAARYGDSYWCIKTAESVDGEVYVSADDLHVDGTGNLLCFGHSAKDRSQRVTVLAFAAGRWSAFYAASAMHGWGIAIEPGPVKSARTSHLPIGNSYRPPQGCPV